MDTLTISRAAKKIGIGVETIRYYERCGLVRQPEKPASGSPRDYSGDTLKQLRFIRQAKDIGFSLVEISELLSLRSDPEADCAAVRQKAKIRRGDIQRRIDQMAAMRDALGVLISRCPASGGLDDCSILDVIENGPDVS